MPALPINFLSANHHSFPWLMKAATYFKKEEKLVHGPLPIQACLSSLHFGASLIDFTSSYLYSHILGLMRPNQFQELLTTWKLFVQPLCIEGRKRFNPPCFGRCRINNKPWRISYFLPEGILKWLLRCLWGTYTRKVRQTCLRLRFLKTNCLTGHALLPDTSKWDKLFSRLTLWGCTEINTKKAVNGFTVTVLKGSTLGRVNWNLLFF